MGCGGSSHTKPDVGDDTEKGGQRGGNRAASPPLDAQPRPAKTGDNVQGAGAGTGAPSAAGQGKSDGDNAVPSGPTAPPPHEVSLGREKHFPGALFKETRWHGRHYLVAVHGDLQHPLAGLVVTAWCDETGDVASTTLTDDELLALKSERGKPIDKFAASAFWRGLSLSLSKNDFKFTDEARIEFSLRQSKEPKNATILFELKKQPKDFGTVFDLVLLPFTHYYSAHVKKDEACDDEAKQEKEVQIASAECDVIATELDTHMLKGELQDLSAASHERVDRIDFLDDKIGQMIRHLNMLKADGVTDLDILYRSEKPTNYEEPKKLDMSKWGDWSYDASEIHGTQLAHVAWTLCCHYDLVEYFDLDPAKFGCFWACMQTACGDNPFHNADRALECMLHVHALVDTLGFGKFGQQQTGAVDLAMEDLLALIMCAGIVDVGHTGMDNNYLIESKDLVSNLYNDQHVTEQRRLAMAFEQLENSNCNFLENLDEDQMKDVRDTVCEILFMRANAEMLDIVEKMAQYQERLGLYDYTRKDDVRVVLTMLFRCADIAAWACVHEQHTTRLRMLVDEFYAQGDAEMTRGTRPSRFIPESPWTADRARHPQDFPRGQVHFFDVMVLPLLESIQSMCPSVGVLLSYAVENRKFWLSQADATGEAETKDAVDTPFSEALRVRPRLFAISKDKRAFFAALSHCDSGQLVVAAATRHGVYSTRATEEYLKRLGGDAASMASHVKDQLSSPSPLPCEVALKSHDSVASVAYMDFSGKQLELKEDPEVSLAFVRRMCRSFVKLKGLQRDKDVDAELEELQTKRAKAKDAQVQQQELLVLHKLCATACDEKHEKQLVEAARLKEELRQRGGHVEEGIVACVRNPLAAPMPLGVTKIPDCRDIDEELFRIIKSQWDPFREGEDTDAAAEDGSEQKFSSVIRPYTKSEFAQVTETLSDTKRQRIWQLVSAVDEWDFDVFALQREMSGGYTHDCLANQPSGGSLFITCYALFYKVEQPPSHSLLPCPCPAPPPTSTRAHTVRLHAQVQHLGEEVDQLAVCYRGGISP